MPELSNTINKNQMKHFELSGTVREAGNKAVIKAFRKEGLVPCNLYGLGMENVLFTVSDKDLKGLICTPASYIVDLVLDNGKKYSCILHELQFHPVKDNCLHVDFLAVNEEKPITINVPLSFTGHPVGVQKGGKFVVNARSLKVKAVMANLPDELTIDTTDLDIEKRIVAGDLAFENIEVVSSKNTIVCTVKATRQAKQAGA